MTAPHLRPQSATTEAPRTSGSLALALALLTVAGWVDAIGYAQWHGVYVSFMSGNTTVSGAAAALGDTAAALEAGRAILAFVLGVVAGELLRAATGRWSNSVVLIAEALLLWFAFGAAATGRGDVASATLTGLAMGVQTAAVHRASGIAVSLTFVTGTLVNIGRSVVRALLHDARWREVLPYLALWGALVLGAASGAIVAARSTAEALAVAAALVTALTAFSGAAAARLASIGSRSRP